MGLISTLFSFRGRANRRALWATVVLLGAMVTAILYLQITLYPDAPYTMSKDGEIRIDIHGPIAWLAGAYLIIAFWSLLALHVKRAHDHNYSGLFVLLFLVPILNIWAAFVLYLLRGTIGDNRYGPDPLTGPAQSWKSLLVLISLILVSIAQAHLTGKLPLNIRQHLPQIESPFSSENKAQPV
tara:strand:+ start:7721 stop:8269 length:549 start_codon:yes stop_codon:yes gene_type:complete